MNRKPVAAAIVSALLMQSVAYADIEGELQNMLMTAASAPSGYNSTNRTGAFFGSANVRTPIKNYTLINWDPPRISAGCGGIDLHLGAFSMINGEAFKQMLRSIMANAAGYFFQLAIQTICGSCAATLNSLADKINNMNVNSLNSCRTAKSIVGGIFDADQNGKIDTALDFSALANTVNQSKTDFAKAITDITDLGPQASLASSKDINPKLGNAVARRIEAKTEVINALLNDSNWNDYLLTLIGTTIVPATSDGSCNDVYGKTENKCVTTVRPYLPMSLQQFLDGNPQDLAGIQYLKCDTWTGTNLCEKPKPAKLPFKGVHAFVHKQLYGTYDVTSLEPAPDSILERLINGKGLSTAQSNFLAATQFRILPAMVKAQRGGPDAITNVVRVGETFVVEEIRFELARSIVNAVRAIASGADVKEITTPGAQVPPPKDIADALKRMDDQLFVMQQQQIANIQNYPEKITSFLRAANTMVPAIPMANLKR